MWDNSSSFRHGLHRKIHRKSFHFDYSLHRRFVALYTPWKTVVNRNVLSVEENIGGKKGSSDLMFPAGLMSNSCKSLLVVEL